MSYTSTMQFLRTGMAPGAGTEDPRFAGRVIAGQTTRFGNAPSWRLTPGAYHDYSSTFRVPGAPPSPGEPRTASPLAGGCCSSRAKSMAGASRADAIRLMKPRRVAKRRGLSVPQVQTDAPWCAGTDQVKVDKNGKAWCLDPEGSGGWLCAESGGNC